MSKKRNRSVMNDEQTETILSKKIKNFHLNAMNGDEGELAAFGLPNQPVGHVDELQERLLTDQIVNYGNSIISNPYSPDTGSENNKNYLRINKLLFEANKMRLLRSQMRLLNRNP